MTSGEDAEFTALVQRQSRFVFRVAYAILRNSYDADDTAQETFLKLYRNRGWLHLENERAFLARATWRIAVDHLRARKGTHRESDPDSGPEMPSTTPGPEEALLQANQHAMLHCLIDRLPEDLRQPLALATVDEMNSREIGDILGIPEGTVRTRLQRARQILRQKMVALEEAHYAR